MPEYNRKDELVDLCIDALTELYEIQSKLNAAIQRIEQLSRNVSGLE